MCCRAVGSCTGPPVPYRCALPGQLIIAPGLTDGTALQLLSKRHAYDVVSARDARL